jgi:hypothetical protein
MLDLSIFDLFDAADDDGYYNGRVPAQFTAAYEYESRKKPDRLRKLLRTQLINFRQFTFIFDRVKKTLKDLDVSATRDAQGCWTVRLNLAKLFMLPGIAPIQELAELRAFFDAIRNFIEASIPSRAWVQLTNNRDQNGRVFGELLAGNCSDSDDSAADQTDAAMTASLKEMVASSEVLQAFLRNSALALQKIGPWSWNTFDENLLYGHNKGPHYSYRLRELREAANAGPGSPLTETSRPAPSD